MTRKLNDASEQLIKQWEELILFPYDDADGPKTRRRIMPGEKVRGTLTGGWGHTGADVRPGMTITTALAQKWFEEDTATAAATVERAVKVPLNDNQFGALTAFVLNIGAGGFVSSTLLKKVNAGDYGSVPAELAKWNKTTIGGKKVTSNGLKNRRAAEAGLWVKGSFVASSSVVADKQRAPLINGKVVSTVSAVASTGALQFVPHDGPLAYALAAVIVIACLVGGGLYVWDRVKN